MSHSSPPNAHDVSKAKGTPPAMAPSPNQYQDYHLSPSLRKLSLSRTASPQPPSSSPSPNPGTQRQLSASPNARLPSRSPLLRSPSSLSTHSRSSTPTLLRKASMNSQHGVGGASVTPSRNSSSSRKSSGAQFTNASALVGKSPLSEIEDQLPAPPKYTAASIASNHFKEELHLHEEGEEDTRSADTIVILHDAVYGHRYSRPRTSKAGLSTIVERPERIQASILGLSVAYVCLGERHADGQFPLHPDRDASSMPSLPFRIRKTTRKMTITSQAVTNVHGAKWMEELKIMCDSAESRLAMNGKELTRPNMNRSPDEKVPEKFHEGDLYLCAESLDAMEGALGAVCEGVDAVFQGSASGKGPFRTFVAIRPPGHHCSASYPSGFCWLNNVHVGISHAALSHGLTHAAIIDFDLHHGDGSQAIAWESNRRATSAPRNAHQWRKTSIGYFSLHDINSYPCEAGDEEKVKNASLCIENAHGQSIWNVHLQPWKSENEFWELYETRYSILLEKTKNYLRTQTDRLRSMPNGPKPRGAIFLSAGFDASEWESSGMQRHKVNVPTEFYARLTRDVVELAGEEGLAVDGRIISVLEGGYSDRALCTGVLSHLSGMSAGDPMVISKERSPTGLGHEMSTKIGTFDGKIAPETSTAGSQVQNYDPSWWSVARLEQLDAVVHQGPIPAEPKKPRAGPAPTYSTPTQSFIAKVSSPSARNNIANMGVRNGSPRAPSRAPSPPPPEVDWAVAAHELSKLLIPTDRQTMSCKQEDLSAEATRARRDRQSVMTPPTTAEPVETSTGRMALRARKPAKPLIESDEDGVKKPVAKASRRKTVAGAALLAGSTAPSRSTTPMPDYTKPTAQSKRRLSLSSNAGSVISEAPPRKNGYRVASNGRMSTRPGTAQSIRPESSMSVRGQSAAPIAVKKTRAPVQPREAPKVSRVRRKSPLNDSGVAPVGTEGATEPSSRSPGVVLPSVEKATSQTSDIDSLTSGMKKVKISLTTKAQREAKAAAAKPAAPKSPRPAPSKEEVATPPRQSAASSTAGDVTPAPPQPEPVAAPTPKLPSTPQPPVPTHLQKPARVPLTVSSPLSPPVPHNGSNASCPAKPIQPSSAAAPDVFIPYQPKGPLPLALAAQEQPLQWLEPNTNTPSPLKVGQKKGNNLPVFTSTSAIPFGFPNPNGVKKLRESNGISKGDRMEGVVKSEEMKK
ncbi:hypothetical protein LZ554_004787 [Drepanopeziza brunnea f. sp. 'monogermtubi']|nr:hypothetical protein LZ554_004787 [Drepanopeziza brunnea f. sp. 'monogermtubi']